ncbi:DNA-binding PadR family transcriptional regulator [Friedmanniella endophytica]|uniref:DNA-binding PadR family transcriptional regulator n=2 Tax=Microlunatus kandeliicorticis TaxID=1759536 RepID=A0A7W3ISG3_9ACTN|nr:DNA-binding PadR family transcriptional regulator [Microlunatus kandeliicorticis]
MALAPLAVSALALLTERPMHPYEMYSLLLKRQEDEWLKLSPGTLYRTVERLVADGLAVVAGTEREGNRPERTTYAITPEGEEALRTRLVELLRAPVREYPVLPFALGEAHNLPADLVVEQLTRHRISLEARLHELEQGLLDAASRGVEEAYLINVDFLRETVRAQRDWLATLITRITTKDLPWPTS